jgi:5-methylcytosine-specific restriction enzyme B
MPDSFSTQAVEVLQLLRDRHNVLISGAPGTGKSRLLEEVARAFVARHSGPVHVPGQVVAIPRTPPTLVKEEYKPSIDRAKPKVFRTVFHQNSKHRDFLTGLVPRVEGTGTSFEVTLGTLYRASEHASSPDGTSLLIIDEINRGPAVQVFGGSIVAMESAKRLLPNGEPHSETQFFELLSPNGKSVEYALPHHLYLLAAMNQADTSVEPLDVAFLRRWAPYHLAPSRHVLLEFYGLDAADLNDLPPIPGDAKAIFAAAIKAWEAVNSRIALGRGREFQIGHGVMMGRSTEGLTSLTDALRVAGEAWAMVRAHVDEVFFGDIRGVAAVLNVGEDKDHPYQLEDRTFADEPRLELVGPDRVPDEFLYALLRVVAGE